ncbi:TlpA family protein disulfide reductase [bacterium]|jgi:peroxiredoxin|nr:TlpA family protein disulfide reductase [bacterium]
MKNIIFFLFVALLFASCGSASPKSEESAASAKTQAVSGFSLNLEKVDGGTFSFEEIRGKKHLVAAFWATWCEPCKQELKKLAEMYGDFSGSVEFVGISTDTEEMIDKVSEFAAEAALPFPILVDPSGNTVGSMIPGGDSVPYMMVVDKNGVVVSRHSGYNPGDEEALRHELETLVSR